MKHTLTLQTGRIQRPQKAVIYSPEGIGKSTLASQCPSPVFLDTEGGSHHLDIVRLLAPKSWEEVTSVITALGSEAQDFRTFVIDTADWLEKLLIEHICQRSNKTSIEDFGWRPTPSASWTCTLLRNGLRIFSSATSGNW
ncbi:MAG: ATP-binding protein [Chthoniobacteraceae bacterium]